MDTVFYAIYFKEELLYIGSTVNFVKRQQHHKYGFYQRLCKRQNNKPLYQHMRQLCADFETYCFKTLETKKLSKEDRLIKERELIEAYSPLCNKSRPIITFEEKMQTIHESYQRHRDVYLEKYKEKHKCEICGGKYTTVNRLTHLKTQKHQHAL